MARTRTVAVRTYQPGTYGPFVVNSFDRTTVRTVRLTLTRVAWPDVEVLGVVRIAWNTGDVCIAHISGRAPSDGETAWTMEINVPQGRFGARDVFSATVEMIVEQAFRTAITAEALS